MALIKNVAKINKINISRMQNASYVQLLTEFKDTILEFEPAKLNVQKYFDMVFMVLYDELLKSFKKMNKSSLTKNINKADSYRDDAFYAFRNIIKAHLRSRDETIVKSAERLMDRINSYGNIATSKLNAQTALTFDLLDELKNKYQNDIELLKLEIYLEEVKRTNNEFQELIKQRYDEVADKTEITVKEVRKELDDAFRNLCCHIEMSVATEDSDVYSKFIKKLNAILAGYGAKNNRTNPNVRPNDNTENKYPNAKEWKMPIKEGDFKLGDICYIVSEDGKKRFFECTDGEYYDLDPIGEEGYLAWKPVE